MTDRGRDRLGRGLLVLLAAILVLDTGCTPRVRVRRDPGHRDRGVRYYRPKPYLLVTPAGEGEKTSDRFVQLKLEYLPDFSEEYSISVTPGLGTAEVDFTLEDGWRLTSLNQKLDSQFDENVGAIADLVGAVGDIASPTGDPGEGQPIKATHQWVVAATNVPIGYYESVVNRDACGKKRLYGWRYVGFAPFNSCPTDMCGRRVAACEGDAAGPIFGLVFEAGAMTFKELALAHEADTTRVGRPTGEYDAETTVSDVGDRAARLVLETLAKQAAERRGIDVVDVSVDLGNDGGAREVTVFVTTKEPAPDAAALASIGDELTGVANAGLFQGAVNVRVVPTERGEPLPAPADDLGGEWPIGPPVTSL